MSRRDDSVELMTYPISVLTHGPLPSRRRTYHRGYVPEPVSRVLVFVLIGKFSLVITFGWRVGIGVTWEAAWIFIQWPSVMLRRHASTMLSGVGPQQVSFVFFIHLEGIPCLRHSPFNLLSFNPYELFALGMKQLMELLAKCYSPEMGLRCRPCCFSQNNSGASSSAVQVLCMRTAHRNLLDNTLSSFS